MPSFDQTPDEPEQFGYKVSWFAVKTSDPASVLKALAFGEATPANWASGMKAAYGDLESSDRWVFISPPISGWVLIVGGWLPYPATIKGVHKDIGRKFDVLLSRLMVRFDDVQFFGSHRGVGFVSWARARNGKPIRIFAFGDGEVSANIGEQTPEEGKLGFVDLTGLSPSDAVKEIFASAAKEEGEESRLIASGLSPREAHMKIRQSRRDPIPDENDVLELAGLWSVDPMQPLDQDDPLALGLVARLPRGVAQ